MNNALPPYVFLPTGLFLAKLIAHKEGEDRSRWVTDFAVQLVEGAGRDDFARSLIDTAITKQNAAVNRVRRSRAKSELISEGVKNPTRQQIEERLKEIYAEEEITADATTREGVDESTTVCKNSDGGSAENIGQRTSEALPSPTPIKTDPKPTKKAKAEVKPEEQKYPHGEFENIMLTTDEYIKLCERLDNADELIAEADQYFEAQPDKKKKYKNHYAMLLSWDRRRKEAEGPKRGYKNINDINRETYEKAKREIHAMFHPDEAKAV
jgi:hypothetical protein